MDALISDGRIYQWGSICEGNITFKALKPQFLSGSLSSRKVVQVVCGSTHSLALTQEGEVYSWGYDDCGQLGIGRHSMETDPVKVSGSNGFQSKVVSVASTGWTSVAVDADGNVIRLTVRISQSNSVVNFCPFVVGLVLGEPFIWSPWKNFFDEAAGPKEDLYY